MITIALLPNNVKRFVTRSWHVFFRVRFFKVSHLIELKTFYKLDNLI